MSEERDLFILSYRTSLLSEIVLKTSQRTSCFKRLKNAYHRMQQRNDYSRFSLARGEKREGKELKAEVKIEMHQVLLMQYIFRDRKLNAAYSGNNLFRSVAYVELTIFYTKTRAVS